MKNSKSNHSEKSYFKLGSSIKPELNYRMMMLGEEFCPWGACLMLDDIITMTHSQFNLLKTQFDESCNPRIGDHDIYFSLSSIRRNIEDMAEIFIAFQLAEDEVNNPFPLSESCFDFLDQYLEGVREVMKSLAEQFSEDGAKQDSHEAICKAIESLKTSLINIDKIFTDLCRSIRRLQA